MRGAVASLGFVAAIAIVIAVAGDGPGPLTAAEVRWRWRHGTLIDAVDVGDVEHSVDVVVACPAPTDGVTARFRLRSSEVRIWERRDPLGRREPLRFLASRRCEDAFAAAHPSTSKP